MPSEAPEAPPSKISLRDAVVAAQRFLNELYVFPPIYNVLLEEVEERADEWLITFGFDTQRVVDPSITNLALALPSREAMTRVYKTFIVDSDSGKVRAMKIHPSATAV
jgi:hypothetical protein